MANDPALAFLDANVLAGPVTRTLLLTGADESGLAVTVVPQEQYLNYQRNGLRRLSSLARLRSVRRCMAAPPYYQRVRNG